MEPNAKVELLKTAGESPEEPGTDGVQAPVSKMKSVALTDPPLNPSEPKISKGAAKKEAKKAANKALKQEAKRENQSKSSSETASSSTQKPPTQEDDPDSMFKVGFLADVYNERPAGSDGISGIVTRCGWHTHLSKR